MRRTNVAALWHSAASAADGTRGVRLKLASGGTGIVGSDRAEELAAIVAAITAITKVGPDYNSRTSIRWACTISSLGDQANTVNWPS